VIDSRPLVWLPFEPGLLGDPPASLRYETVHLADDAPVPDSVAEVEFYVPAYRFRPGDSDVMALMPRLKVVQTQTAGVEHIAPYVPDGVLLCNGRGIHNASTAELTVALMLASLRGIPRFVRAQDRHAWEPLTAPALADRTVLVIGYGAVGAALEDRLTGFEVDLVRVARSARGGDRPVHPIEDLPGLLPSADVVVLITPLTEATRGLVDAEFLSRMKDGALLVNVARGPVVDTGALVAALHTGRLHAALDVTDPEPLPADHPLWDAPNLLVSPHVGGASSAMEPRAYRLVREQLQRFAEGRPLENVMNGDY
jgi:phosphoglycerate dehydrogenase-like enzyme